MPQTVQRRCEDVQLYCSLRPLESPVALVTAVILGALVAAGATYPVMSRAARAVLSDVLQQLNAQAEAQRAQAETNRAEAIRLATQAVQSQGDQLLGARAGEIDRELKAYTGSCNT